MIRGNRNLLLAHIPANALLMWLGYEWLGVDESSGGKLLLSAVDALAILALVCWLWGATLVWFRGKAATLNEAFRTALRHIGGLLAVAVAALVVYGLVGQLAAAMGPAALKIASWLTLTIRRPVKPASVGAVFGVIFWLVRWMVLPVMLIPVAGAIAAMGRGGWRALRLRHSWRAWLGTLVLTVAGVWVPLWLVNWRMKAGGFAMEFASFSLRAVVAYAMFLGAMLVLARMHAGGVEGRG